MWCDKQLFVNIHISFLLKFFVLSINTFVSLGERQDVCVTALESSGPALLGHCIAKSLVSRKIPAKIIADLNKSTSGELHNVIQRLQALICVLPHSLSSTNLLMYCAFQAAFQWSEDKVHCTSICII